MNDELDNLRTELHKLDKKFGIWRAVFIATAFFAAILFGVTSLITIPGAVDAKFSDFAGTETEDTINDAHAVAVTLLSNTDFVEYGKYNNWGQLTATAMCSGALPGRHIKAVQRQSLDRTCNQICPSVTVYNAVNSSCLAALHVYDGTFGASADGAEGPHVLTSDQHYCAHESWGPNYCCCGV